MIKHTSPISGIASFKDQYIATAGYDNKVILWNAASHEALACGFHDHLANQCQFSPCGQYLLSSSSDYSARLWSVPSMRLLAVLGNHEDDVEGVAFHPTKALIATVSRDHHLRIFDFSGMLLMKLSGHKKDVLSAAWLNEKEIITSSDDGTIKKWNIDQRKCIATIDLGGIETDTIALTPSGVIFAGNDEGSIIIIHNDKRTIVPAHKAGIKRLSYSPAKNKLISLSYDRSFCIWEIINNTELKLLRRANYLNKVWARSCDFLRDAEIVFATFESSYIVYNYEKDRWDLTKAQSTHGINAVIDFLGDIYSIGDAGILFKNNHEVLQLPSLCNFLTKAGKHLVTGGQTGELFDALTAKVIYSHHSPLNCGATFKKNNEDYCIIGSYTGEGIVVKVTQQGYKIQHILNLHNNAIKSLSISKNRIFSVCATGAAAFHDLINFDCITRLENGHEKIANGCTYLHPEQFASVSRDLKLRLFNRNEIEMINTPHTHSIKCIAASEDGRFIATGGYHGEIHIYDRYAKKWHSQRPTIAGISSLYYSTYRQTFLASSYDGHIYSFAI